MAAGVRKGLLGFFRAEVVWRRGKKAERFIARRRGEAMGRRSSLRDPARKKRAQEKTGLRAKSERPEAQRRKDYFLLGGGISAAPEGTAPLTEVRGFHPQVN